jgi:hypothetical protein
MHERALTIRQASFVVSQRHLAEAANNCIPSLFLVLPKKRVYKAKSAHSKIVHECHATSIAAQNLDRRVHVLEGI